MLIKILQPKLLSVTSEALSRGTYSASIGGNDTTYRPDSNTDEEKRLHLATHRS